MQTLTELIDRYAATRVEAQRKRDLADLRADILITLLTEIPRIEDMLLRMDVIEDMADKIMEAINECAR